MFATGQDLAISTFPDTDAGSADEPGSAKDARSVLLLPEAEKPCGPAADSGFRHDVAVVGLGYVGLPTALAFHDCGLRVLGVDISRGRLTAIRSGEVDLIARDRQRLDAALAGSSGFALVDDVEALGQARTVVVCVPTPVDEHLMPDLLPLVGACRDVVRQAREGQLLVLTSTTYVGCTRDMLVRPLAERGLRVGEDIWVAFSPERIDPGNDRYVQRMVPRVVGGATRRCTSLAVALLSECAATPHAVSSMEAAELTKLYENTFRAVNISLANEFADISGVLGVDVTEVIDAAATKPYGFMPFYPGPGVGGHCIPCDPQYLLWQLRSHRTSAPMIEAAMSAIAARPGRVVRRAIEVFADRGLARSGVRVLVVGVTYKPGVCDIRESPALEIIERLRDRGADVAFTDDMVDQVTVGDEVMHRIAQPGAQAWDLVIVHTVHPGTDLGWLARQPAVLDTTYRLAEIPHRSVL